MIAASKLGSARRFSSTASIVAPLAAATGSRLGQPASSNAISSTAIASDRRTIEEGAAAGTRPLLVCPEWFGTLMLFPPTVVLPDRSLVAPAHRDTDRPGPAKPYGQPIRFCPDVEAPSFERPSNRTTG
jgi:hypothetical protein